MRVITDLQIVYESRVGEPQRRVLKASYVELCVGPLEQHLKGEGEFTVCEIPPKQYDDCE